MKFRTGANAVLCTPTSRYPISTGPKGLEIAVKKLCEEAEQQVRDGAEVRRARSDVIAGH